MKLHNGLACVCWLKHLAEECQAASLFGSDYEPVVSTARLYDLNEATLDFYAESPLLGPPGIDLSVSYPAGFFLEHRLIDGHPLAAAGDFIEAYGKLVAEHFPKALNDAVAYLEGDTSQGHPNDLAIFLTVKEDAAFTLLPKLLDLQGMSDRAGGTIEKLRKIKHLLTMNQLGFMNSREGRPVRLNLMPVNEKLDDIIEGLRILGCRTLLEQCEEILREIDKLGIMNYVLGIDVLADGSIGDTFGIEMGPKELLPTQHRRLFQSEKYRRFIELLQSYRIADERVLAIPLCSWNRNFHVELSGGFFETHVYSFPSHFKLKWNKEGPMPAKIYLSMRTMDRQNVINETIPQRGLY
ncbi:MAG: hypothetical protein Q4D21_01845 [Phascolarctobacterium sp.]|nr:hypothetical protein [Phascolarctobacterium sp.]